MEAFEDLDIDRFEDIPGTSEPVSLDELDKEKYHCFFPGLMGPNSSWDISLLVGSMLTTFERRKPHDDLNKMTKEEHYANEVTWSVIKKIAYHLNLQPPAEFKDSMSKDLYLAKMDKLCERVILSLQKIANYLSSSPEQRTDVFPVLRFMIFV